MKYAKKSDITTFKAINVFLKNMSILHQGITENCMKIKHLYNPSIVVIEHMQKIFKKI